MNRLAALDRFSSFPRIFTYYVALTLGILSGPGQAAIPAARVGDVDGDGAVTVRDAQLALLDSLGQAQLTDEQRVIAALGGKKPNRSHVLALLRAGLGTDALPWSVAASGGELDGVCFLPDGSLLFTDYNVKQIRRVAPDGTESIYRKTTGSPSFMQAQPDGRVILCNYSGQVEEITPEGAVQILAKITTKTGYGGPLGLALGPQGRVYVSVQNLGNVHRIDPGQNPIEIINGLKIAAGLALTDDGRILVADVEGNKIMAYNLDAEGKRQGEGVLFARVNRPHGIQLDRRGRLWVASIGENHVYVFDPGGALLQRFTVPAANATNLAFGPAGSHQVFVVTRNPGLVSILTLKPTDPLAAGLP